MRARRERGLRRVATLPRLPCHKSSSLNRRTNRKSQFAAQQNMRGYVRRVGEDRIGVLTLTTADECRSLREFQRRWNSLMTNFIRRLWKSGVWVRERQMRTGNWHGHALVDVGFEIRQGFPFEEVARCNYGKVDRRVRDLWKQLREKAPRYGFGRMELLPIKSNSEWAIKYLTSYLGKALWSEKTVGEEKARLFGMWGCVRSAYSRFDWVSGRIVRRKKAWLAWAHGVQGEEAFSRSEEWYLFVFSAEFHAVDDWVRLLKRVVDQIGAELRSGVCEIFPNENSKRLSASCHSRTRHLEPKNKSARRNFLYISVRASSEERRERSKSFLLSFTREGKRWPVE